MTGTIFSEQLRWCYSFSIRDNAVIEVKRKTEQQSQWDGIFNKVPDFFGHGPSEFGRLSLEKFQKEGVRSVLELGCGQGRDTFLFAQSGLEVTALDYSDSAVDEITNKANSLGFSSQLLSQTHDVREPLPYPDESFDACFSHMLLCMELSTDEIAYILQEVHRVLSPGGFAIYSVRSNFDKHFGTGIHLGGDLYELGDFVIHFFTMEKIYKLARGYDILNVDRREEGGLPRDLFCVSMKKGPVPESWDLNSDEVTDMSDSLNKFQSFMDAALAPGSLDNKTKQLVALGSALAAGCDP